MKKLQKIFLLFLLFIGTSYAKPEMIKEDQKEVQLDMTPINKAFEDNNALKLAMPYLPLARLLSPDILYNATGYTQEEIEEKLALSQNFLKASLQAKARDYADKDHMLEIQKKRVWFRSVFSISTFLSGFSYYHVVVESKKEYAALAAYSMLSSLIFGMLEIRRNYKKNSLEKELETLKKQERCLGLIGGGASLEVIKKEIMQQNIECKNKGNNVKS